MKRIIRLTETDLKRIVRRVIRENADPIVDPCQDEVDALMELVGGTKLPAACMGADMESACLNKVIAEVMKAGGRNLEVARQAVMDLYDCRKENSGKMF